MGPEPMVGRMDLTMDGSDGWTHGRTDTVGGKSLGRNLTRRSSEGFQNLVLKSLIFLICGVCSICGYLAAWKTLSRDVAMICLRLWDFSKSPTIQKREQLFWAIGFKHHLFNAPIDCEVSPTLAKMCEADELVISVSAVVDTALVAPLLQASLMRICLVSPLAHLGIKAPR